MKHQQIITKPVHLWKTFNVFFAILIFFFIGCKEKNDAEKKDAEKMNTDSVSTMNQPETSAQVAQLSGDFYTLKLTSKQYDTLRSFKPSNKIVFQFLFRRSEPKSPTMLAYPAKKYNIFFPNTTGSAYNPAQLTIDQPFLKIEPVMILGDQEISYKDINDYLKLGNIKLTDSFTLVFSPNIDTTKHIYYKVTVEGVQTLVGTLETNPSPPKDAINF